MKEVRIIKKLVKEVRTVVAIEPIYGAQGGRTTRVYTTTEEVIEVNKRPTTVLENLANFYGTTVKSVRCKAKQHFGSKQYLPLPFSRTMIMVPIKMRQIDIPGDSVTGYVNYQSVIEVVEAKNSDQIKCTIKLKGGHNLPSYYSYQNTRQRMLKGAQALALFNELNQFEKEGFYFPKELNNLDTTTDELLRIILHINQFILKALKLDLTAGE